MNLLTIIGDKIRAVKNGAGGTNWNGLFLRQCLTLRGRRRRRDSWFRRRCRVSARLTLAQVENVNFRPAILVQKDASEAAVDGLMLYP